MLIDYKPKLTRKKDSFLLKTFFFYILINLLKRKRRYIKIDIKLYYINILNKTINWEENIYIKKNIYIKVNIFIKTH